MYDILFTGDCFVRTFGGGNPFTEGIANLMRNSKNVCVNLETTVGVGGAKIPKAYNFQVPPQNLQYLKDCGVNITSVANNHSLDYGEEGFSQTLENLKKNDFHVIGSAEDNVCIVKANDVSYCISSYFGYGGSMSACNESTILNNIKKYRSSTDIVIVCLHWGEEYSAYPKPKQQQLARKLIDNGVDVVIGHHPHVPQGIEEYKGKYILYSLGNFNFNVEHPYHDKKTETKYGYCVGLYHTKDKGLQYDIIPIHINKQWQPEIIEEKSVQDSLVKYLEEISTPLPREINPVYYYSHSAIHIFKNYYPSWHKQIKEQGKKVVLDMIKWHIHPTTFVYYIGVLMSAFVKKTKLKI